jgi:hypothetical protein
VTGLALNRLDRREGLVLVQAVAGNAALPDEIMTEVFERADGVPLFVEELTKAGARNCRSQTAKRLRSLESSGSNSRSGRRSCGLPSLCCAAVSFAAMTARC